MNCKLCQSALPDLLLDPTVPANSAAREHMAACAACAEEYASLAATFALLDTWEAPEVSPYFDQKLTVRLREEQAAPPAGFFERLKARMQFNTGRQFRPALVGSLALLFLAGGGGVGFSTFSHFANQAVQVSPAINDLQILDKNEQALQQMNQVLDDSVTPADSGTTTPQS